MYNFSRKDVVDYVNSLLNTEFSVDFIRKFMKSQLNMSFINVKSSSSNINLSKIKAIRQLNLTMNAEYLNKNGRWTNST